MPRGPRVPEDIAAQFGWHPTRLSPPKSEPCAMKTTDQPILFISVQSQKGGVGKSTAALALGELLAGLRYRVLVVDTDVTGTSLSTAVTYSHWHDTAQVVRLRRKESSPFDLAQFFVHEYVSGKTIPEFSAQDAANTLSVDFSSPRAIHVIGSTFPFARDDSAMSPDLLFNEIYSLTFVEYLKEISQGFHKAACSAELEPAYKTAIIFDNSPGYVGIVPSIEEWLTDLGPVAGKFLFLTSADYHDITAVGESAAWLNRRIQEKWRVSRSYLAMRDSPSAASSSSLDRKLLSGEAAQFFLALAESDNSSESISPTPFDFPGECKFYLHAPGQSRRHQYVSRSSRSIGTVFNLIPESLLRIIRQAPDRDLRKLLGKGAGAEAEEGSDRPEQRRLLGLDQADSAVRFVPFDPALRDQYMSEAYSVLAQSMDKDLGALDILLSRLSRRLRPVGGEHDGLHYASLRALTVAVDLADRAVNALALHGSDFARSQIRSDWLPSSILSLLRDLSFSLMPDLPIRITPEEGNDLARRSGMVNERVDPFFSRLADNLGLEQFGRAFEWNVVRAIVETLALSVEVAFRDSESIPFNDMRIFNAAERASRLLTTLAVREFPSEPKSAKLDTVLAQHFARAPFKIRSLRDHESEKAGDPEFDHAFTLLCQASSRIVFLRDDVEFLFGAIRALAELEPGDTGGVLQVSAIFDRWIVERDLSLEEARMALAGEQIRARQRTAFHSALRSIATNWGISTDVA